MCEPESPFYLQVHQSWNKTGTDQPAQVWYKDQPLGEHSLGNMMKEMARDGGLPGRKTNHSGRKTTVKRLKEAGFENTDIMQVTGHKNVQSLNSYCTVPNKTMKKMSETLTECDEDTENAEFSDIPDDELSEILGAIENIEQIHPSQVSSTETGGISDIQMSSSNTLNKAFGLGTSMLSGANISGGSFVFNINFNSQ